MTHRKHNADVGSIGTAAKRRQIVNNDNDIIHSPDSTVKPSRRKMPTDAAAFALDMYRPSNAPPLATAKQQTYLASLRKTIGLPKWNAAKTLLGIETSGTHGLTKNEASNLISLINLVCSGRELER